MSQLSSRPRPIRPSRKKYQEALRCLKQAASSSSLPWVQRLRACELICAIYGVAPIPDSNPNRTRKTVRVLVEENAFESRVRDELRAKILEQARLDAEAEAERLRPPKPDADAEAAAAFLAALKVREELPDDNDD